MNDEMNFPEVDGPEFERFRTLAQQVTIADTQLVDPPADIWLGIEEQLTEVGAEREPAAPVIDLDSRRKRRFAGAATAIAAAAAVVVGIAVVNSGDSDAPPLAEASLINDDLPVPFTGAGQADLITVDGQLAIEIELAEVPDPGDGYLELWVIDTSVEGMHSLGVVDGSGVYTLPPSVDPAGFPVVDISVEQGDGVPTHSGQSVLRGVLDL